MVTHLLTKAEEAIKIKYGNNLLNNTTMSRRRALLATSQMGGGNELTFPVTLVEGDNGELGTKVYEWCKSKNLGVGEAYYFTPNEVLYLEDTLSTYFKYYESMGSIIAFAPKNGKWTYVLNPSGNLSLDMGIGV